MLKCCLCKKKGTAEQGPFFRVPKDEWRRSKWTEICRMDFVKNARICADHFLSTDIIIRGGKSGLMPSAVPFVQPLLEKPIPVSHAKALSTNSNITQDVLDITMKKNKEYQAMIKKLEAENKSLRAENEDLKCKLAETKAVVAFMRSIFTEGQIKKMVTPGQVQWKRNDISNAIRLHASGPKAYNYLYRQGFPLPHASVLEHWCRNININIHRGFMTSSLRFVKHCTELTREDKICVLSFDEMKVMETNENDSEGDSTKKTPSFVQVVIARGLWKSWKRPVFFDFDCQMTTDLLYSIIEKLNFQGFPVVAMVCDMGPSNRQLWKDLGVTTDRPYFPNPVNPNEKVFTFIDSPHLLEVIRYHYLDTGFVCINKLLTSRPVADLMKNSSQRVKLTDEHLSIKAVGAQKLAAELFSKTTANAIRSCKSPGVSLETADLIQLINDWFDVLNSTINTFSSPGKEPFGTAAADQERTLRRMNTLMSSPLIPNKTSLEYFQEAVIITNAALEMLYDFVKQKYNMAYIFTTRLNQGLLKHLFGTIRSKCSSKECPTTYEFRYRLRKYILAQNLEHLHGTENLESDSIDWDTLTISKYLEKSKATAEITAHLEHEALHEIVADRDPDVLDEMDTSNFDDVDILEDGTLAEYISAYTVIDEI